MDNTGTAPAFIEVAGESALTGFQKDGLKKRLKALAPQLTGIEGDVQDLISAMNESISEARSFIEQMET